LRLSPRENYKTSRVELQASPKRRCRLRFTREVDSVTDHPVRFFARKADLNGRGPRSAPPTSFAQRKTGDMPSYRLSWNGMRTCHPSSRSLGGWGRIRDTYQGRRPWVHVPSSRQFAARTAYYQLEGPSAGKKNKAVFFGG